MFLEEINRKIVNLINSKDLTGVEFFINFSVLQCLETFCESRTNNNAFNAFIKKHNIIKTSNRKRVNEEKCVLGPLVNIAEEQLSMLSEHLDLI